MEERKQKIEQVREMEKAFINQMQDLISHKYLKKQFSFYKLQLSQIQQCYENPNYSLAESENCSQQHYEKYAKLEDRFERIIKKYQDSISDCTNDCQNELQRSILDCYKDCFVNITQMANKFYNQE